MALGLISDCISLIVKAAINHAQLSFTTTRTESFHLKMVKAFLNRKNDFKI
jgi:hypothetical protein